MQDWKTYAAALLGLAVALNHYFNWVPSELEGAIIVVAATVFGIQIQSQMQGHQQAVRELRSSVNDLHVTANENMRNIRSIQKNVAPPPAPLPPKV